MRRKIYKFTERKLFSWSFANYTSFTVGQKVLLSIHCDEMNPKSDHL